MYITSSITQKYLQVIRLAEQFPNQFITKINEYKHKNFLFSSAERCILSNIAKGLSDCKIAERLNYSIGTVKNILSNIKSKTKLNNRAQIIVFALIFGIINLDIEEYFNIEDMSREKNNEAARGID